jgi:phosphate transport system substrate-binding protein
VKVKVRSIRRWSSASAWRILVAVLLLVSCSRVETPKVTAVVYTLRVAADTALMPLMRALTDAYTAEHPNILFTLQNGNAQTVGDAIYARQADLAAVSLLPPAVQGRDAPWIADLAQDGVAVVVNRANPLDGLTLQDLRDVFAGVRNRWSDYGVVGLEDIEVAVREEGDGARATFDSTVMGNMKLTLSAMVLPTVDVAMNFVSYEANAISYVPSARITATVAPPVKVLRIDGQLPTPDAVRSGAYRLTRMLNLIALSEPQGELRKFVAWVLSPEGQSVVETMNYVRLAPSQPPAASR